jgi:hypothetical protein
MEILGLVLLVAFGSIIAHKFSSFLPGVISPSLSDIITRNVEHRIVNLDERWVCSHEKDMLGGRLIPHHRMLQ